MRKLKKLSVVFFLVLSTFLLLVGCINATPEEISVTFIQEGQVDIIRQVEKGETLEDIPTPVQEVGYTIVWDRTDFSNLTENIRVNAVKTANEYEITLNYGGYPVAGYPVSTPPKVSVTYGEEFTLPTPTSNYGSFVKWTLPNGEDFTSTVYNFTQNITLKAVWEVETLEITFVQEGQADIIRQVEKGATLEDIPTPVQEAGYSIVWERTDFSNLTENIRVNAVKTANEYEITLNYDGYSVSTPTKVSVTYGEGFSLPIPTNDYASFVKWTLPNGEDFTSTVYNFTQNITLKAVWENKFKPQVEDYVDFVVNVESGREIRVLQLTDIQTLDAEQTRYINRGVGFTPCDVFNRYHKYIGQVIESYKPDLIIMTGDNVYGEFDDSGKRHLELIQIMDSYKIPWAPVFGNHDNESNMGVDWQCKQFENSEYCLFKQRTLTGNGNYTVGITQDGELKRVFYMLDSNGCAAMSAKSKANGHSKTSVGFGADQIEWYTKSMQDIAKFFPKAKLSMAFHIQLAVFEDAYKQYGYNSSTIQSNPLNLDKITSAANNGDFGYIGRPLKNPWDTNYAVWNGIKSLGVDSIFVGHEHCNSASVVYQGVRLTYGQKSSTFDRYNCEASDGTYNSSYNGTPVMGGTFINLSNDGSISDTGIIYYDHDLGYEEPATPSQPDDEVGMDNIPEGATVTTFDFNDTDFDLTSSTEAIYWQNVGIASDTDNVPAGFTDSVAFLKNSNTACSGIIFNKPVYIDNILGIYVRMYVQKYAITSGKAPLLRIYDNEHNEILCAKTYASMGGEYDKWIYVDILPLIINTPDIVSDGEILPFTLVYRFYGDEESVIYFDSLTIISQGSPYVKNENERATSTTPYDTTYYEYALNEFEGNDGILDRNETAFFQINEQSYALSLNLKADTFTDELIVYGYTQDGTSGIKISIIKSKITIGRESVAFTFNENVEYEVKIGFASLYDGNTVYVFVMINGTRVAWELVESYGKTFGNLALVSIGDSFTLT